MIYKAFAAATLVLALLIGLMADRLTPSRVPAESHAVPAPVASETPPYVSAPPVEQEIAPLDATPAHMPAFGQPMPGSDTPSLRPGNGLPGASIPPAPQNDEEANGTDAETPG